MYCFFNTIQPLNTWVWSNSAGDFTVYKHPLDAVVQYRGPHLHVVEIDEIEKDDGVAFLAKKIRTLKVFDMEYHLRRFAADLALSMTPYWTRKMPDVVHAYLTTLDPNLRENSKKAMNNYSVYLERSVYTAYAASIEDCCMAAQNTWHAAYEVNAQLALREAEIFSPRDAVWDACHALAKKSIYDRFQSIVDDVLSEKGLSCPTPPYLLPPVKLNCL